MLGENALCQSGESNPRRFCAWLFGQTLYQLSCPVQQEPYYSVKPTHVQYIASRAPRNVKPQDEVCVHNRNRINLVQRP